MTNEPKFSRNAEILLSFFNEFLLLSDLTHHHLVLPIRYRLSFIAWSRLGKTSLFTKIPAAILLFFFNILPAIPLVVLAFLIRFISDLLGPLYFLTTPFVLAGAFLYAIVKTIHTFLVKAVFGGTDDEFYEQIFVNSYPPAARKLANLTEEELRKLYRKLVTEKREKK